VLLDFIGDKEPRITNKCTLTNSPMVAGHSMLVFHPNLTNTFDVGGKLSQIHCRYLFMWMMITAQQSATFVENNLYPGITPECPTTVPLPALEEGG
jgi:hypothetical protein